MSERTPESLKIALEKIEEHGKIVRELNKDENNHSISNRMY